MKAVPWVLMLATGLVVAGCDDEDDWVVRPPGGHGNADAAPSPPDAIDAPTVDAPADAPTDGVETTFDGLICVVDDLRAPDACPAVAARAGVMVRLAGGTRTATSGMFGRYVLAAPAVGPVVLEAGDGAAAVVPSTLPVTIDPTTLLETPVVLSGHWTQLLATLGVSPADTSGTIAIYVEENGAPVVGATFTQPVGSFEAPYYDAGGALVWTTAGGTGVAGVALLFDVPAGTPTITGLTSNGRAISFSVPVRGRAVTFVRVAPAP